MVIVQRLLACLVVAGSSSLVGAAQAPDAGATAEIRNIVRASTCAKHYWRPNRGIAPSGYIEGVALVYARALCHPERPEVRAASAASSSEPGASDALDAYRSEFEALGMADATKGPEALRHTYALLTGLGMQESSGRYCVGRDLSMNFTSADSAEAGLIQTSFGVSRRDPSLPALFARYKADEGGCMLSVFRPGARCSAGDARTWGSGEGAAWQQLTKRCPAFAVEYGAVVMRVHGGRHGEFGPIRRKTAEIVPECDAMLSRVADVVRRDPAVCSAL